MLEGQRGGHRNHLFSPGKLTRKEAEKVEPEIRGHKAIINM